MDRYRKDVPPNSLPCLPVGKSKERSWPGVLLRTKSCINVVSESLHPQRQSISGLVAEFIVAIDVSRVRFPADASLVRKVATLSNRRRKNSATGTRTRVARVRTEYLNQLDYSGFCHTLDKRTRASADLLHARSTFGDPRGASARQLRFFLGATRSSWPDEGETCGAQRPAHLPATLWHCGL